MENQRQVGELVEELFTYLISSHRFHPFKQVRGSIENDWLLDILKEMSDPPPVVYKEERIVK